MEAGRKPQSAYDAQPMPGMEPALDVSRELGLLARSLKGLHHAVQADLGMRVELPASALLAALHERGELRLSSLAEVLHLDLSSVSRQATALEREGWVSRTRDPADSRAALLSLTDRGQEVLDQLRSGRARYLRERLAGWSDDELRAFAAALHRLRLDLAPDRPDLETAPCTPVPTERTPALAGRKA